MTKKKTFRLFLLVLFIGFHFNSSLAQECKCTLKASEQLEVAKEKNDTKQVAKLIEELINSNEDACLFFAFNEKMNLLFSENKLDSLLQYLKKQDKILKKNYCNQRLIAAHYNKYGMYYGNRLEVDSSVFYFLKALEINKQRKDTSSIIGSFTNLSLNLLRSGKPEQYIKYASQGIAIGRSNIKKYTDELVGSSRFYMDYYQDTGEENYLDSLRILLNQLRPFINDESNSINYQYHLSYESYYFFKKDYKNTLIYLDSAKQFIINPPVYRSIGIVFSDAADTYIEMKDFQKAKSMADSAVFYANKSGSAQVKLNAYKMAIRCNELIGDFKNAYFFSKLHDHLKDSIFNQEKLETVNELEQKYNKSENEKKISELNTETQIKNLRINILIALIGVVILILIGLYLFFRQRSLRQEKQNILAEQRLNRARMNPHFFFNLLSSLQSFSLKQENFEKVPLYLSKYAKIMRQTLESTYDEEVSINEEIDFLNNYLNLQQVRFPNKFDYTIEIDPNLNPDETIMPAMILQPFIENSIEHGFKNINHKGLIEIKFTQINNTIQITVSDNGQAISTEENKTHVSRATQITKERLSLLNKNKSNLYQFNTTNKDNKGYLVMFVVPLKIKQ